MTRKISNEMLTAYVLNELKEETKKKIDIIKERDESVREAINSIRAVVEVTSKAFEGARDPGLSLTDDQRTQVRRTAQSAMGALFSGNRGLFDTPAGEDTGPDFSGNIFNTPPPGALTTDLVSSVGEEMDPKPKVAETPVPVGGRNENSVLFSLSNLQDMARATTATQPPIAPSASREEASGSIDIRALAGVVAAQEPGDKTGADLELASSAFAPALAPHKKKSRIIMPLAIAASVILSVLAGAVIMNIMSTTEEVDTSATDAKIAELTQLLEKMQAQGAQSADAQRLQEEIANLEAKKVAVEATAEVKTEAPELARATRSAGKKKGSKRQRKSSATAASRRPEKPAAKSPLRTASKESDLDDLLRGGASAKTEKARPSSSSRSGKQSLPATPTKSQVKSAMKKVASRVQKCAKGQSGTIKIRMVISGSTGRVKSAKAATPYAGTPTGTCAERAVKAARLPKFQKSSLSVTYPFKL